MTREEAISIMKVIVHMLEEKYDTDRVEEAVDMAISALSEKDWKFYYDHGYAQAKRDLSENKGDLINRQAVLNTLENMDRALDEDRTVENYKELLRECYKVLPPFNPQKPCKDCQYKEWLEGEDLPPVNPQKPKSEWEHDHEILRAYSDGASAVLESLIEQYEHYLELLDADMKDGSATIVTKTKYAVYTEVVKQLKEVLESEDKA